ncbi:hypothetical protein P5673_000721 [Acropora cervicornis]|uniref:Uncharacterized protein n=1 Tax=Acropora cervicornis TaxID=6130 RepID=A0AAD9R7Q1_ACRCE|nr:hypothetical protein P5673_000721 [Acropora cervicornis]
MKGFTQLLGRNSFQLRTRKSKKSAIQGNGKREASSKEIGYIILGHELLPRLLLQSCEPAASYTCLSFLSPQVMSCYLGCYFSHANQRPLTPMSSVLPAVVGDIFIHSLTLKCPFSELNQRPFTPMSSVLSPVVGDIFIHSLTLKCPFSELNQRPFTPMSSVLSPVVGDIFIHSLTLKCPLSELSQRSLTL